MSELPRLAAQPGLRFAFSTAEDGNMSYTWGEAGEVRQARTAFLATLGLSLEECVGMQLEHKDRIEAAHESDRGRDMAPPMSDILLDALVTDTANVPLFMIVADCIPCIVYDPVRHALALAHLSSRSSEAGLVKKVVSRLKATYDSQPQDLVIGLGPSIRKESYLLPRFDQESQPEWQPFVGREADGQVRVDLPGFVTSQFVAAGVPAAQIEVSPTDTAADPQYFSHYRSKRTGEPEARFGIVAWLTP